MWFIFWVSVVIICAGYGQCQLVKLDFRSHAMWSANIICFDLIKFLNTIQDSSISPVMIFNKD